MSLTLTFLLIVQILSALAIIILVLLQQGKGADMGSSFGSGSAGSLFGASGAANFLSRTTKWAAVIFFASTAGLAYISHKGSSPGGLDSGVMQNFQSRDSSVPQAPDAAPAPNRSVPAPPPSTSPVQPDPSIPQVPAPAAAQGSSPR